MLGTNRRICARTLSLALLLAVGSVPLLVQAAEAAGGAFDPQVTYGTGTAPRSVAVGDFNGDGDPDLAVANQSNTQPPGSVSILLGQAGGGTFGTHTTYNTGTGPTSVAVGDFNADGDPDLVLTNFNNNSVSVLLGGAAGTFGTRTDFATGAEPVV